MTIKSLLQRLPEIFWTEEKDEHINEAVGGRQLVPGQQFFKLGIRKEYHKGQRNDIK